jgi:hypothetical protein
LVRWHVWRERTYSATSTSWPTQKARRRAAVVALAENLRAQSAADRDAEAVRLTLPAAIQETAAH